MNTVSAGTPWVWSEFLQNIIFLFLFCVFLNKINSFDYILIIFLCYFMGRAEKCLQGWVGMIENACGDRWGWKDMLAGMGGDGFDFCRDGW